MTDDHQAPEISAPGPRPAAQGSPLSGLRARRAAVVAKLHIDLAIPRYDPPAFVRYAPLSSERLASIEKQFAKSKDLDKDVKGSCVALAEACLGVYELDEDGEPVSVDEHDRNGEWPKFDERLAEILGMPAGTTNATRVIRELYATDGDVLSTSGKLAEWSGYSLEQLEEREGN